MNLREKAETLYNPLVSICIPTFNGAAFIADTLDSAIVQTYPNLEIIVSDDASSDRTLDIVESYKTKTTIPIFIYPHKPNGIGANWNHCMQKAKGTYIKFLFQDDVLLPHCIETMVHVLEENDAVAIVACKREFIIDPSFLNADSERWINIYGDLQNSLHLPVENGMIYLDSSLFKSELFFESPLNKVGEPSTILFRKNLVDSIGYFREDLHQVLDYEFCYRVLKKNKIAIIVDKLVKFRLHNQQATVINKGNETYGKDHEAYQYLMYKQFFWYLKKDMRKVLLRKYNKPVNVFYNTIDAFKRVISK